MAPVVPSPTWKIGTRSVNNMGVHTPRSKPPAPRPTFPRWSIAAGNLLQPGALSGAQSHRAVLQLHQTLRRLATRYEHAANFLAMLKLAATQLWLRHNESVT
jgi:hypothetical protein